MGFFSWHLAKYLLVSESTVICSVCSDEALSSSSSGMLLENKFGFTGLRRALGVGVLGVLGLMGARLRRILIEIGSLRRFDISTTKK